MNNIKNKYDSEKILHIKNGNLEYIQFKRLNEYADRLFHAITLRHGGVSKEEYSSLNFRTSGKDSKENVLKNLEIFCNKVNINKDNIFKSKQAHTSNILILDDYNKEKYRFDSFCEDEFDGYITDIKNIGTLVTVADCNCIIIYDPIKNVVSNIHSGWKGTVNKIYMNAIDLMIDKYSSNVGDLIFCFGPSIRKCCFSSKEESFKEKFINVWENQDNYMYYKGDRFFIDLIYVITEDLLKKGLKEENIIDSNICTMCNSIDFFSNRASKRKDSSEFGTIASITSLI